MADTTAELPFVVEYAKSSRASCKGCKSGIDKDSLRMAIMVPMFDNKVPHWYHYSCFWEHQKIINVSDIKGFADIRPDDQERIKKVIESGGGSGPAVLEYAAEYAKSNRSKCKGCDSNIEKGSVRVSKRDLHDKRFGVALDHWYHVHCVTKVLLANTLTTGDIEGFDSLKEEDRQMLRDKLKLSAKEGAASNNEGKGKKRRSEGEEEERGRRLEEQTKVLWEMKDGLRDVPTSVIRDILRGNEQHVPAEGGKEKVLRDHLVDVLMFGTLPKCPDCGGHLMYTGDVYTCVGSKCTYETCTPRGKRGSVHIPDTACKHSDTLKNYKFVARERLFAAGESTQRKLAKQNAAAE